MIRLKVTLESFCCLQKIKDKKVKDEESNKKAKSIVSHMKYMYSKSQRNKAWTAFLSKNENKSLT